MTYTPDPTNLVEPDPSINAGTAAAEFVALKNWLALGLANRNLLVNGSFQISQKLGAGNYAVASGTSVITLDQWYWYAPLSGATVSRGAAQAPYPAYLQGIQDGTAPTGNNTGIFQRVEASRCQALTYAAGVGVMVTVSGWMYANSTNLASLIMSINLSAATAFNNFASVTGIGTGSPLITYGANATWQYFKETFAITGAGTNGVVLSLGVAGAGLTNAILRFANIQLEVNAFATPFEYRSYQQEMMDCQRYYCLRTFAQNKLVSGPGTFVDTYHLDQEMLANPTVNVVVNSGDTVTGSGQIYYGDTIISISDTKGSGTVTMAYNVTCSISCQL